MNTIDCIKSRRSVRKFTEEKVPHEVLEQLVDLAGPVGPQLEEHPDCPLCGGGG